MPRSSPCPCGSGRRYKECHGAIRKLDDAEQPAPRSGYRPKGADWDHLPESKRAACGQMMEFALRSQTAGDETEAERLYREVLRIAPNTHDALHMLGAISLRRGDLFGAETLIKRALLLRQEYPGIRKNMTLVEDAIRARQQGDVRILCELALPLLGDEILLRGGHGQRAVASPVAQTKATHIIADFRDPAGEAEWFARRVASLLAKDQPTLWSIHRRFDGSPQAHGVRGLGAVDRRLPLGGVQILVGINCPIEGWIEQAMPERLLVFGLAASPACYLEQLRNLAGGGAPPIELVFRSRVEAARFGRVGPNLPPPIEISPGPAASDPSNASGGDSFTLGTLVCEEGVLRSGDDGVLLQALAGNACRLSIFEPGELRNLLGAHPAIQFHSRRELSLPEFLARIDGLLHRAPDPWQEGCGLALFGAMALGLPVVCSRDSLYAEYIEHTVSGLLYSDEAEVVPWVQRLAHDTEWARLIGDRARARALELFDPATLSAGYRALLEPQLTAQNR